MKETLQKIKISDKHQVNGFYTLLTNGSVVCLPNNEYLVPDYVLSVLVKRGIQFKMENNNGDKIKSSISNTPKI